MPRIHDALVELHTTTGVGKPPRDVMVRAAIQFMNIESLLPEDQIEKMTSVLTQITMDWPY